MFEFIWLFFMDVKFFFAVLPYIIGIVAGVFILWGLFK